MSNEPIQAVEVTTPPLDPIKAIVDILDIMIDVAAFDDNRGRLYDKLSALKRSLGSGE